MLIYILDYFGIAVGAVTGAIAAGHKKMDLFGLVVVAIVTAVGGGTLRDLTLGIRPLVWVANPFYVVVASVAALLTFVFARFIRMPEVVLLLCDAVALATFTVIGCQRAVNVHVPYLIVIIMGVMTGVAGGVFRDILCTKVPFICRGEIYATASLIGSCVFAFEHWVGIRGNSAMMSSLVVVLVIRLAAIYWSLSLPVYRSKSVT